MSNLCMQFIVRNRVIRFITFPWQFIARNVGTRFIASVGGGGALASLILGGLSCIGMLASIWLIFFYTPIDTLQGVTQRIFYFHVPTAWVGMFAFVVLTVAGIVYLIKPDERLDWIARASGEVG